MRIRTKVVASFVVLSAGLAVLSSAVVLGVFLRVEDGLAERQVRRALEDAVERLERDPAARLPSTPALAFYRDDRRPPAAVLRALAGSEGVIELEDGGQELHAGRATLSTGSPVWVALSVEDNEALEAGLAWALLAGTLVTAIVGALVGLGLSSRIVGPLEALTRETGQVGSGSWRRGFAEDYGSDEVGALARTLEAHLERNDRRMERERRFIEDASHELRTPLTIIRGVCDLLDDEEAADPEAVPTRVARIRRAVLRMQHTVESLLRLARSERQRDPEDGRPLGERLEELWSELRDGLAPGVELVTRLEAEPGIAGETALFLVALGNLVRNAIECTEEGAVVVAVDRSGAEVADTGPGIAPERVPELLAPWRSGSGSAGYGLGLSIVQRICERTGWALELGPGADGGTTARLVLRPVEAPADPEAAGANAG